MLLQQNAYIWHHIKEGEKLSNSELGYLTLLIMTWIKNEIKKTKMKKKLAK